MQKQKKKKGVGLIFLDTETSGLGIDAQILQFAAIYGILDGKEFHESGRINQYINITAKINYFAQQVHGISKSMVEKYEYIDGYIDNFLEAILGADYVIGHNISFDIRMLKQDCCRIGKECDWDGIKTFCTMKDTSDLIDIPGRKWPKLSALHVHLFGKEFENAHDAMADIEATKNCFLELAKRGKICLK